MSPTSYLCSIPQFVVRAGLEPDTVLDGLDNRFTGLGYHPSLRPSNYVSLVRYLPYINIRTPYIIHNLPPLQNHIPGQGTVYDFPLPYYKDTNFSDKGQALIQIFFIIFSIVHLPGRLYTAYHIPADDLADLSPGESFQDIL